jgi:hypothetical protein
MCTQAPVRARECSGEPPLVMVRDVSVAAGVIMTAGPAGTGAGAKPHKIQGSEPEPEPPKIFGIGAGADLDVPNHKRQENPPTHFFDKIESRNRNSTNR